MGACVGTLGVGQGVPRRGQRLHGHMGGGGQGRDCRGGGHRRGGVRLPAAENRLTHQQHGGQGQRRQARTAQHPHMAALARAQPRAGCKGVIGGIPAQLTVALGHGGDSFLSFLAPQRETRSSNNCVPALLRV